MKVNEALVLRHEFLFLLRCFKRFNFWSTYFIFEVSHSLQRREKEDLTPKLGLDVKIHILKHKVMSLSFLVFLERDKRK